LNQVAFIVAFVLLLGAYVYLVLPRGTWRAVAVGVFVILTVTIFAGAFEGMGLAKPIRLEWRKLAGSQIIAFVPVENVAIYLWIVRNGEPVVYRLPWSTKEAQELQDGLKEMREGGGMLELGAAIDGTPGAPNNGEITKTAPPPSLPPKDAE
jgi:hypothetical protein